MKQLAIIISLLCLAQMGFTQGAGDIYKGSGICYTDSIPTFVADTLGCEIVFSTRYKTLYRWSRDSSDWKLITVPIGGESIPLTLPLQNMTIDANGNVLTIDSLGNFVIQSNHAGNTAQSRLFVSGSSATGFELRYVTSGDTALVKLRRNANSQSEIELDAESILLTKFDNTFARTGDFSAIFVVDSNGKAALTVPDSIPAVQALQDSITALRTDLTAAEDSITVLRSAISSLETSAGLRKFEGSTGVFNYKLLATDTTGLSVSKGGGTATVTIPTNVGWGRVCFEGSDSDIPIQDFTVQVNTTSTVLNQGASSAHPVLGWIIARNASNTAPSPSSFWVIDEGNSPQRRITNISNGDNTMLFTNVKNDFNYWTICVEF